MQNRRRSRWLAGSDDWIEFPATLHVRALLGGLANIDQFRTTIDGEPFEGVSLRTFDPETEQWTIYWMDARNPRLVEQVTGWFKGGVGQFHGQETFKGVPVQLRFNWRRAGDTTARWEQASFDDRTDTWETNWIMQSERAIE